MLTEPLGRYLIPGLSAVTSLEVSTDRAIPPHLMKAAIAYDAADFEKRKARGEIPARVTRGKVRLKDDIALPLMAHLIAEAAMTRGAVERADFERRGITADQIERLSRTAYVRALNDRPGLATILGEVPPC